MFENINNFIIDFLMKNSDSENIAENWNSKNNQKSFLKVIKKDMNIKDPNKPKRGKSGYLYFCQEYRKILKEENPTMSIKDIVSKLGLIWKGLKESDPEEIEKFELLSRSDRERYKIEIAEYNKQLKSSKKSNEFAKKKKASKNNGYEKFIKTKSRKTKKTHPELDTEGVLTYLTKKWEKYPEDKKEKYLKK
jgi:hypothetical protein